MNLVSGSVCGQQSEHLHLERVSTPVPPLKHTTIHPHAPSSVCTTCTASRSCQRNNFHNRLRDESFGSGLVVLVSHFPPRFHQRRTSQHHTARTCLSFLTSTALVGIASLHLLSSCSSISVETRGESQGRSWNTSDRRAASVLEMSSLKQVHARWICYRDSKKVDKAVERGRSSIAACVLNASELVHLQVCLSGKA